MTLALPREGIRPAWRAAVLAYRREYQATREDLLASAAAFEAFREALPEMPEEQAKVGDPPRHRLRGGEPHGVVLGPRRELSEAVALGSCPAQGR
jgi:hypothetical protein